MGKPTSQLRSSSLFVGSLAKGISVLECFSDGHSELGITEISQLAGLEKSAANRLVNTLATLGYLERNPASRRYQLSPRLLGFAFNFLSGSKLIELAMPRLTKISEITGCSAGLCILDGASILYLARQDRHEFYHPTSLIGERQPAYCTTGGRAIMSRLTNAQNKAILDKSELRRITNKTKTDPEEILKEIEVTRDRGYAIQIGEFIPQEANFAAPILDNTSTPVAALLVSTLYDSEQEIGKLETNTVPHLLRACDEISGGLGAQK